MIKPSPLLFSFFRATIVFGCVLILFSSSPAAQTPMQVLQKTAAVYQNLASYEFKVTVQTRRGAQFSEQRLTEMGSRPGKFRIEDADSRGELRIADGQDEWVLNKSLNKYTKSPLNTESQTPISNLESIDKNIVQAEFAREELFVVDGTAVPVVVVDVVRNRWPNGTLKGAQSVMYRIDERNFRVYKVITYSPEDTQIVLYSILKWNQSVPDASFAFTPPPSSQAVSSAQEQAAAFKSLVGSQAPDFDLQDVGGHLVNLHTFLGKVVIVDFWATWCGPCRTQMPELQRMSQELEKEGLIVLGLNVGETASDVLQFAKRESYTFPLLLGAEPEISAKYFVEAYPTTFVIDRQGRITFRSVGSEPPDRLRSAVAAALHQ